MAVVPGWPKERVDHDEWDLFLFFINITVVRFYLVKLFKKEGDGFLSLRHQLIYRRNYFRISLFFVCGSYLFSPSVQDGFLLLPPFFVFDRKHPPRPSRSTD
jgi:hypothetical protein